MPLADCTIVLLAAGTSSRMGFDKLWVDLCGRPLIAWPIRAAQGVEPAELVIVAPKGHHAALASLAPEARLVEGGARRRDSVAAGLAATSHDWVAIHDGARPLVPTELFAQGLVAARESGAAVPGIAVTDTIKRRAGDTVAETLARDSLVAIQTPQVFRRDLLSQALASSDEDATDEAVLLERLGYTVAIYAGDERNVKATTPLQLALLETLITSGRVAYP